MKFSLLCLGVSRTNSEPTLAGVPPCWAGLQRQPVWRCLHLLVQLPQQPQRLCRRHLARMSPPPTSSRRLLQASGRSQAPPSERPATRPIPRPPMRWPLGRAGSCCRSFARPPNSVQAALPTGLRGTRAVVRGNGQREPQNQCVQLSLSVHAVRRQRPGPLTAPASSAPHDADCVKEAKCERASPTFGSDRPEGQNIGSHTILCIFHSQVHNNRRQRPLG